MEKEKKWVRKGQRLLAKLGAACISEKGNGRPVGLMDLHLMWKPNDKPTIWGWFLPAIYGDISLSLSLSIHRHIDIGIVYYWVYHIVSLHFLPQGDIKQYA